MLKRSNSKTKNSILDLKSTPIVYLLTLLLVIVDQLTKTIFTNKTYLENSLIFIRYTQNKGSAFGIFSTVEFYNTIMIVLSIVILIALVYHYRYFIKSESMSLILIFFSAGIIGNFLDRIFFGYVRDFIAIKYLFIFNLADLYLTILVILVIWHEFKK